MSRIARLVTAIIFLIILAACGGAVVYFGTADGLGFGGSATVAGTVTKGTGAYVQIGWVRNNAPWPITVTGIEATANHAAKPVTVYLSAKQETTAAVTKAPAWATPAAAAMPVAFAGGTLRYLGFAMTPAQGEVASFDSITVTFTGPLGITFHKSYSGDTFAVASDTLPAGTLALDPTVDSGSLDGYIELLRNALQQSNSAQLAVVMGSGVKPAQAQKFAKDMAKFQINDNVTATRDPANPYRRTLVFYATSPTKDGLPPIRIEWSGFRWSVLGY